ncbi:PLP-dependent transferase [Rhizophagus irregularis]|uniref:PLP-dependent transferase n=1 Tax=Rhizophagus irregularis TaxID=588596 RepID=A0A2I1GQG9_9GLOM|nr:PLP-dependent transferase [Rhizophagus irregularis]
MVALEGGTYTISTSSGQAAQFVAILTICSKVIYLESMGNPKFNIPDFEAIRKIMHDTGIPVIVDNTFGGYLIKLIEHGADIVIHSATKWIEGHGTTIGGVVSMEFIDKHTGPKNALELARWLESRDDVLWVSYRGFEYHENAKKYMWNGFGCIFAFGVKGDANVGATFIDALRLARRASTTHQQLTDEEQLSAGVNKEMINVSVGYEHVDDIKRRLYNCV